MSFRPGRSWRPVLMVPFVLLMGCDPQDVVGSGGSPPDRETGETGGGSGGGTGVDPEPDPPEEPRFTISVSASDYDPFLRSTPPVAGPYDLYLWSVCSNYGLAQLQVDLDVTGDALVPDHYFSPAPGVYSIDWEEYGDVNVALPECPKGPTLLGTIHLEGSGTGGAVCLSRGSEAEGAMHCDSSAVFGFSVLGFSSSASPACEQDAALGCHALPPTYRLTVSGSSTNPYVQTGTDTDGPTLLYLWNTSGGLTALQAEIHILGTDGPEPFHSFAGQSPYISLSSEDGPDVLLASPTCQGGPSLLGSILVLGDGSGMSVTLSPGIGGGVALCGAVGQVAGFQVRPYTAAPQ